MRLLASVLLIIIIANNVTEVSGRSKGEEINSKIGRLPLRDQNGRQCLGKRGCSGQGKGSNWENHQDRREEDGRETLSMWSIILVTIVAGFGLFYRIQLYVIHRAQSRAYKNFVNTHIVHRENPTKLRACQTR